MTTVPETPTSHAPPQGWHDTLGEFRARAQRLFEAQQKRIRSLEQAIAGQLECVNGATGSAAQESASAVPSREEQELRSQLAQTRKLLNVRAEELKKLRNQLAAATSSGREIDIEPLLEERSELRMERDQLVARIAEAEQSSQRASAGEAAQLDELRQRFEKAVQEIRELKTKNAALEAHSAQAGKAQETVLLSTGFDWEEQKRKIMEQLDDSPANETVTAEQRLSIESTIRITDEVVARKDREIADLRAALNDRVAAGGNEENSMAELLDRDELIRAERENLMGLQEECREKQRQAEIDISVERAKLARERAELEERGRAVEAKLDAFSPDAPDDGKAQKQQSGRWLSRLGLKDDDK